MLVQQEVNETYLRTAFELANVALVGLTPGLRGGRRRGDGSSSDEEDSELGEHRYWG